MTDELNKEIRTLKMQIAKLQLESKLRRNLASELDKQKQIAKNVIKRIESGQNGERMQPK